MSDPFLVLGTRPGASFEELRTAYRRACKTRHPDMGGSQRAMIELNAAYSFVLNQLRQECLKRAQEGPEKSRGEWSKRCRDIDEQLAEIQRSAIEYEERFRRGLHEPPQSGPLALRPTTPPQITSALRSFAFSSIRGLAAIFAALLSIGTLLVETNLISALVIAGSGLGFFISVALKSDKGGFMSAGILLFGIATIWVPEVRAALVDWPVATISVLLCLALIFKFSRDGGLAGLLTGGVLAVCLIGVIVHDTLQKQTQQRATSNAPIRQNQTASRQPAPVSEPAATKQPSTATEKRVDSSTFPTPSMPSAPRELLAAFGSILKFVDGVPYQLKLRSGMYTRLTASTGAIALYSGNARISDCMPSLEVTAPVGASPYVNFDRLIRACNGDAIFRVSEVR